MNELFEYWKENPPAHELLIIISGYKPPTPTLSATEKSAAMDPLAFLKWTKRTSGRSLSPNG